MPRPAKPVYYHPKTRTEAARPAQREPRRGSGRWDAVVAALDSWPRTLRLCLILVITAITSGAAAVVITVLAHHVL